MARRSRWSIVMTGISCFIARSNSGSVYGAGTCLKAAWVAAHSPSAMSMYRPFVIGVSVSSTSTAQSLIPMSAAMALTFAAARTRLPMSASEPAGPAATMSGRWRSPASIHAVYAVRSFEDGRSVRRSAISRSNSATCLCHSAWVGAPSRSSTLERWL